MSILNEDLEFCRAPDGVRRAFASGRSTRRLLQPGHELYKFTQYPLVGSSGRVTPWWSSVEPLAPGDPSLSQSLERGRSLGVTAVDFARARSAVTKQWNSMAGLLLARLTRPVYGFVGQVAHQPIDEEPRMKNAVFIGGAWQVWIPHLSQADIRKV